MQHICVEQKFFKKLFFLILILMLNSTDLEIIKAQSLEQDIDSNLILALANIESNNNGFEENRMKIRLENHLLVQDCSIASKTFSFDRKANWKNHYFTDELGNKLFTHKNQENEYKALSIAKFLCGDISYNSISMGMFQMLGKNYKEYGFPNSALMYSFLSESTERQLQVFFMYLNKNQELKQAFMNKDFNSIAKIWNSGNTNLPKLLANEYARIVSESNHNTN